MFIKYTKFYFFSVITLGIVLSFLFIGGSQICSAQGTDALDAETTQKQGEQAEAFLDASGFEGKTTVGDIISAAVKAVLSLLAIIFLIIIIITV